MLKPPWGINVPLSRPSDQESSADLQADVMRFMAILAFCLLAVFALVQSVPKSAQEHAVTQAPNIAPERPKAKPPVPPPPKSSNQSRQATPIQITQDTDTTSSTHPQITKARPPQDREHGKPKSIRFADVKNEAPSKSRDAGQTNSHLPKRPSPAADVRTSLTTDSLATTQVSEQTAHDDKGFALRFESDLALESLVAKDKVRLFGRVGKRIWRLSIKSGQLRFHPTTAPRQFHAMTPESVPIHIVTALRRDAAVLHPDRVAWGVTLPPATTDQILRHLRESSGGSLLIQADGQVRLQDTS